MSLSSAIQNLKCEMDKAGIVQENGLGTELFHFSSTLAPVVNVDLVITDASGRILLSWRNDKYDKSGWHIPGSCIRFRETLEDSIQRCAKNELGIGVIHSAEPIKVYEFHWSTEREGLIDQRERAHFITLVYACQVPDGFSVQSQAIPEDMPGYLKWFDTLPDNLVPIQERYRNDWEQLRERIMEENTNG